MTLLHKNYRAMETSSVCESAHAQSLQQCVTHRVPNLSCNPFWVFPFSKVFFRFVFPSFPFLSFPFLFPRYFSDLFFVLNGNVFFAFMLIPQNLFSVWSSLWFFSSCLQFWLTRKIPSSKIDPWKIQSILQTLTYALRKPLWFSTTTERNRPLVVSETFAS